MKILERWNLKRWGGLAVGALSFATGVLISARLTRPHAVRAEGNRVYELNIYHAVPGKEPDLEAVWRDASKVVAAHGIKILGYWVPNEDPAWKDTFIYVVRIPEPGRSRQTVGRASQRPRISPVHRSRQAVHRKSRKTVSRG